MKTSKPKLPRLPTWLLKRLLKDQFQEELLGDLEEMHAERISSGRWFPTLYYWLDVIHLALGFSQLNMRRYHPGTMIRHYTVMALRNMKRNRIYSGINILSLGIGMAVTLFLAQHIQYELSYDQFHVNHENTYRIVIEETNTEQRASYPDFSYLLGVAARDALPEVVEFVRKERCNRGATVSNPQNRQVYHESDQAILFVDPSFFEVFSFPLVQGDQETIFDDRLSLVITAQAARKYFGTTDPIGKQLTIDGPPSPGTYTVTGILQDPPQNGHMQFDFLIPMDNYLEFGWGGAVKRNGGWNGFHVITYLQLSESAHTTYVESALSQLIAEHVADKEIQINVRLQPLADIHMKSATLDDPGFMKRLGSMQNIRILSIIGAFILIIAWANFINLNTANALQRAKEVGIRKSLGAFKKQLIGQFLLESLLINLMAFVLACGLLYLVSPVIQQQFSIAFDLRWWQNPIFWYAATAMVLTGALLAGLYPAFYLSSLPSLRALTNTAGKTHKSPFRSVLITFQLLVSMLLIAGTLILIRQTNYLKQQELGLDLEQILLLRGPKVGERLPEQIGNFRETLKAHHHIQSVSGTLMAPGEFWVLAYRRQGRPESEAPHVRGFYASSEFAQTFGLQLLAGTLFNTSMKDEETVIINQKAVRALGFASPEDALHQKLHIGSRLATIVGVVENFQWHSAADAHQPYVITLYEDTKHPYLAIRMDQRNASEMISFIESTFEAHFPGNPYDYSFADEVFQRQYQAEMQFGKLFLAFSSLAIFIAGVGLFALVSFAANRRTREIGIRKVLGASVAQLMLLLTREYARIMVVVMVLAIPTIIYFGNLWLSQYAARIAFSVELVLVPGLILLLIVMATVTRQTHLTARANPVEALRKE